MYDTCAEEQATGTIQAKFCGPGSPLLETFTLSAGEQLQWSFESDCGTASSTVSGTVLYEDFVVSRAGRSDTGVFVPARSVTVQAVRASDGLVLGEGTTGRDGEFEIAFGSSSGEGYKVRVLASVEAAHMNQQVRDLGGSVWQWQTGDSRDETETPHLENLTLRIDEAAGAAALNIMDVGYQGFEYGSAHFGDHLGSLPLVWRWWPEHGGLSNFDPDYVSNGTPIINIAGRPSSPTSGVDYGPDDYDDTVMGHEFGHFVQWALQMIIEGGGEHSVHLRSDPKLAWSEGFASAFGGTFLGTSSFVITNELGEVETAFSLEEPYRSLIYADGEEKEVARGFQGDALSGELSELVVAGLLWDIFDDSRDDSIATSCEEYDAVEGHAVTSYMILYRYLSYNYSSMAEVPSNSAWPEFADRGVAGRDLVDFLDGWVCWLPVSGLEDMPGTSELEVLVRTLHGINYDFADAAASCLSSR
jgi:hypothetical protein